MFHDSELMTSMARKLQELEQQLKVQNDEILSKVGPGGGDSQGALFPRIELAVLMASHEMGMILVPMS